MTVAAGYAHSLGLKSNGSVVAWGWNNNGQCNVPAPNTGFVAIAAGLSQSLGLKADGSIVAWGSNTIGHCDVPTPNGGFGAIAAGWDANLAVRKPIAVISRNPASLSRTVPAGQNLPQDTFTVANIGTDVLSYSVTADASWLLVDPPGGTAGTQTDTLTITYNTAGLAIGQYTGRIVIMASGACNSPQMLSANLTVISPYAPVDHDKDGDVDQEDFGWFQVCLSGPGMAQNDAGCLAARLDTDDDVDAEDLARFLKCMAPPNHPASPTCAN